jgi:hypothetical protein
MTVQDDAREKELCNLFNLNWDPNHARAGTDAHLDIPIAGGLQRIDFEVKSTTGSTVSTARDVGTGHIERWRCKHWIIGFYESQHGIRARLRYSLYLTPLDLQPWLDTLEEYIQPDVVLAGCVPERLSADDLISVCGEKPCCSIEDAKRIFKKQWKTTDYERYLDYPPQAPGHYSPERMLGILKLRARYTMDRGATLNNPHIPKKFLDGFSDQRIDRDHAQSLRTKLNNFLRQGHADPTHSSPS